MIRDCFDICTQNEIISKCACYLPSFSNLNKTNLACKTAKLQNCAFNTFGNFSLFRGKICSPFCPLECDNIQYSFSTSSSEYPGKVALNIIKENYPNLTEQIIKKRVLSFRIYYSELKFIKISQVFTTNIWDMITSIGGALGLFIGGSLLSILEIFYGAISVLGQIIKKPKINVRRESRRFNLSERT